ncbi:sensor histidine kinase [Streptomyces sp. NBC_01304]|uniref:sensor histidine kinase n=1 Tax=Streptomyces sp. NBC_01304 TaxID=2903818 RepID=UPI002E1220C2|nr:histidine kinase [Streptomyces sp. NBC_01304]
MNDDAPVPIGRPPQSRREALAKFGWIAVWLVFLAYPVKDLADGHHSAPATLLGCAGLVAFGGCYLALVLRFMVRAEALIAPQLALAALLVLATVLAYTLGDEWLGLFVYVSVASAFALPFRQARWMIPLTTVVMVLLGLRTETLGQIIMSLGVMTLMIGFAMTGVRHLIHTTIQLREARATVAELAANEERLRLARDLHDLLGHSLSLITLKSELAGRMLPAHPDKAAEQVADIERVSRQALVDVREAVSGYRRATLPAELAGARTALTAAGIEATIPPAPDGPPDGPLGEQEEAALAWALREAVTNVVRHSGAHRCTVDLTRRETLDGPVLELTVEDDGKGGGGAAGNGLTGLTERLEAVGGTLESGPGKRGFRLLARVPVGSEA